MLDQLLSVGGNFASDRVIRELKSNLGGISHAMLGTIGFDVLSQIEGVEESFSANFAEHALIEGKPRLQWVGDNLGEVTWNLMFHAGFCVPTVELLKLRAAVAAHTPLPLVFASGAHQGWFVPVSVNVTTRMTRGDGTLLWIEAQLKMRESPPAASMPDETPRQSAVAIEQNAASGSATMPSQSVYKTPAPRPAGASPLRSAR
ncbi:MAG: hypothetical protein AUK53_11720 [Betaproteobacteria bacterium CG2_30_59_46]|nr:MAG: hypothetical protein AUK53_11720 [Betaproteobacteria bacterium CG2_30_59_46]